MQLDTNQQKAAKAVKLAAFIAIIGNLLLAVLKIAGGWIFDSSALIADGTDSFSDVIIAAITLAIVNLISKPADKKHPWGHRRAETIATSFLSFAIFFVGAQLIVSAVTALVKNEGSVPQSDIALIITAVSVVAKIGLALSQHFLGKKANSAIIKANAKNMAADVIVSLGVMAGLLISMLTSSAIPDKVLTILIGLWIIKTAFSIFRETNIELMDGTKSTKVYRIIAESVSAVDGADNPHRARMRHIAGMWDISFDVFVSPDLSVAEAHDIANRVEDEIKRRLDNVFDIMVHIEPHGDESDEAYGLCEHEMLSD